MEQDMIQIYDGSEYPREAARKKRMLTVFFVSLGVILAVCIGLLIWYTTMPYKAAEGAIPKYVTMGICAVFAIFSYPILAIKFRRQKMYVKLMKNIHEGLRSGGTEEFVRFETKIEERDGVDFQRMITYYYSEAKDEYYEHKILIDAEKPLPSINPGEMVHFITHGNVLLCYEIVPRPKDEPTTQQKFESVEQKKVRDRTVTLWDSKY